MTNPIISKFFNINRPSVALIIIAWLAFNFNSIFLSYPLNINELLIFFFSLLVLEVIFSYVSNKKVSLSILLCIFLFLFGYLIVLNIQNIINNLFDFYLRGRILYLLFLPISIIFIKIVEIKSYYIINIFLFIFIITGTFKNLTTFNSSLLYPEFVNKKTIFPATSKNKSILLLILDEYHSPDDLFRVTNCDSSVYNFSTTLKNSGWQTNNSFYSNELSTIRSLSSIFNYNLSNDKNFNDLDEKTIYKLFTENLLSLELNNKKITYENWGIFQFGTKKPNIFDVTPKISTNLFIRFLKNSALSLVYINTENLNLDGFAKNFYPSSKHNIEVLKNLKKLGYKIQTNNFIYSHLYMPHPPFFLPEFFKFKKTNLINYISFWKFTNSILIDHLIEISSTNDMKIIVTGDHGFRNDSRLNKNLTFLAIYGFDSINIEKIKSVQDLGGVIISNY
jgi:hypothetical protein